MKLYLAGNFPMLSDPKRERRSRKRVLKKYPRYRRLVSFYYPDHVNTALRLKGRNK